MNQVVCSVWCKPTYRYLSFLLTDENGGRPWCKPHTCRHPSTLRWTHSEDTLLSTSCCQQSHSILISVLWKDILCRKQFLLRNFYDRVRQNLILFEIYIVKYYCLHLAEILHDFFRLVKKIFKAWVWTACKRLAFHCLCWIYGTPLAQILCSAWEHTRKYWFAVELIGIAAFGDIWTLIALINLAIKTSNLLLSQKGFWSQGSFS